MNVLTFAFGRNACFGGLLACAFVARTHALEVSGLLDLRAIATDTEHSWPNAGLDKTRFDRSSSGLRLGQGFLKVEGDLSNTVSAALVVSAQDDRKGLLDVNEAWLAWSPVPSSAWRSRVKFGAFFPVASVEIDYDIHDHLVAKNRIHQSGHSKRL